MSGGHWNYQNDTIAHEIFGWGMSPDYGEKGFSQSKHAARWNQVRCEDCKHCDFGGWNYAVCRKRSMLHNFVVHKGEYCNFAEERNK